MKKNLLIAFAVLMFFGAVNVQSYAADGDKKAQKKEAAIAKAEEKTAKKEAKKLEKEAEKAEKIQNKQRKQDLKQAQKEEKQKIKETKDEAVKEVKEIKEIKEVKEPKTPNEPKIKEPEKQTVKAEDKKITKEKIDEAINEATSKEKAVVEKAEPKKEIKQAEEKEEVRVEDKKEERAEEKIEKKTEKHAEEKIKEQETSSVIEPEKVKEEKEAIEAIEDEKVKIEKTTPEVYKKNLTYEDIDKKAVSINEFLQFTDKQNEKFSLFYYKTISKLNLYSSQIKTKQKQIKETKSANLNYKTQYEKLKKLDRELDFLLRERDDFYNNALSKFNSILTKKQAVKWEVLQQMGYRFLPELD